MTAKPQADRGDAPALTAAAFAALTGFTRSRPTGLGRRQARPRDKPNQHRGDRSERPVKRLRRRTRRGCSRRLAPAPSRTAPPRRRSETPHPLRDGHGSRRRRPGGSPAAWPVISPPADAAVHRAEPSPRQRPPHSHPAPRCPVRGVRRASCEPGSRDRKPSGSSPRYPRPAARGGRLPGGSRTGGSKWRPPQPPATAARGSATRSRPITRAIDLSCEASTSN